MKSLKVISILSIAASVDDSSSEKHVDLTEEKLLEVIESSYPNPITIQDLSK